MIRGLSGVTVLLLIGVLFLGGALLMRNARPKPENPLEEAQQAMLDELGFEVELAVDQRAGLGGLPVLKVAPNSAAQRMGLRVGDAILAVNESSVWHAQQLQEKIDHARGQRGSVRLMVRSQGVYRTLVMGGPAASPSSRPPSGASRPSPAPARAGG